jgi:uncharacterized membrane protein YagU involved in acid resistance
VSFTASHSLLEVVLWGGFISGSIDLFAACTFAAIRGITPNRLLQTIASAMIGPKAFGKGSSAVALGLGLHFLIAFTVATTYVVASRYLTVLTEHSVLSGLLYGAAVHLFMTFIVLPLSSLKRPFSMTFFLGQLAIHMLCVGLPISLVVKHFSDLPLRIQALL